MAPMTAPSRLKRLEDFELHELESVRLMLRGDSVIDWHRLNLERPEDAAGLVRSFEFDPEAPRDRVRLDALRTDAVGFLRRQFDFPIPKPVEQATCEELLMMASTKGHRQTCACAILKTMHIIHHLDGRELLFCLPMSDQDVFHLVEEKVYRVVGEMLSAGMPIVEFVGGRKNKDSLYTKLMSKSDASASQIYDKVRFRIVTRKKDDILPVLLHLTQHLFPFSLVLAGESINTIFHFKSYCEEHPHLRSMIKDFQTGVDDAFTPSDNQFSDESYRVIHFVVDLPIRLPDETMDLAPPSARALGPVVFVLCEFQIVDQATEQRNEQGNASHERYKDRQKQAVKRRLKIGVRPLKDPSVALGERESPAPPPVEAPPEPEPTRPKSATRRRPTS